MPAPVDDALADALGALVGWLTAAGVPYALIGGLAVSLQAEPRFTEDVDVVIWVDDDRWPRLIAEASAFRITPRRADVLEFAARTRVLLLQHATGVPIDVSCGALPFEQQLIADAAPIAVGPLVVRVASAARLLVMKAVANRPRDWADIESLIRQYPSLDTTEARRFVREFAEALEMPDILEQFDRVVGRRR